MNSTFNPIVELGHGDRASLQQIANSPGYIVLHRIMRAEADKFIQALINTPVDKKEEVYSKFLLAKAAAQFFTGVTNTVNEEITQFVAAPRPDDLPVDQTEGILDLDSIRTRTRDLPNLLEEEGIINE